MEYVGHQPTTFHASVHTRDYNHIQSNSYSATTRAATACGGLHTHSMHWTEDQITIGVDGIPYFAYRNIGRDPGAWPFDQPHHLILNIAVGGWGGAEGIDPAAFPAQMEVDYVRVYQSPDAPRHLVAD